MQDEVQMVTSCPLCLAPDEAQSMVTVEIDRRIAGGRIAIIICRSCAGAVIRAIRKLEPPLLTPQFWIDEVKSDFAPSVPVVQEPTGELAQELGAETQAESAKLHEEEEPRGAWFRGGPRQGSA